MGVARYPWAKAAVTGTLPPQGLRRQPITPRLLKTTNLTIHRSVRNGIGSLLNLVYKEFEMGVVRYRLAKAPLTGTLPPQSLRCSPLPHGY